MRSAMPSRRTCARSRTSSTSTFAVIVRSYVASEDQRRVGEKKRRVGSTKLLPGKRYVPAAVFAVATFGLLYKVITSVDWKASTSPAEPTIAEIGTNIMTSYIFPFEFVSLVLLAAMIGAAILIREHKANGEDEDAAGDGEAGAPLSASSGELPAENCMPSRRAASVLFPSDSSSAWRMRRASVASRVSSRVALLPASGSDRCERRFSDRCETSIRSPAMAAARRWRWCCPAGPSGSGSRWRCRSAR